MMQRRLSQIAQIPLIIQSTLDAVARSFDDFLPPEQDAPDVQLTLIDLSAFVESTKAKERDHQYQELLMVQECSSDHFDEDDEDRADDDERDDVFDMVAADAELEPEPEPEVVEAVPEPTEEEIQKMEKIERVIFLMKKTGKLCKLNTF